MDNLEKIDYEEVFKDEHKPIPEVVDKAKSGYLLIAYFIIFMSSLGFILASLIGTIFVNPLNDESTNDTFITNQVSNNTNLVGLVSENSVDFLEQEQLLYVKSILIDEIMYDIIINIEHEENLVWLDNQLITEEDLFNLLKLKDYTWDSSDQLIKVLIVQQSHLETYFGNDFEDNSVAAIMPNISNTFQALAQFLVYLFATIVVIILFRPQFKTDFNLFIQNKTSSFQVTLNGFALMLFTTFAANLLLTILQRLANISGDSVNQASIESIFTGPTIGIVLMVISVVIFAPIVEEFVFRKAIFSLIKNPIVAIITSSLAFSAMHILSEPNFIHMIINIIPYLTMGLFIGWYYHYKADRNIMVVIAIHALNNLLAVVGILFV